MKKYRIRHGNIAALLYVTLDNDPKEYEFVYVSGQQQPTRAVAGFWPLFDDLPLEVRAAINRQFGQVFSLPLEQRGAWVRAQVPFDIEVSA